MPPSPGRATYRDASPTSMSSANASSETGSRGRSRGSPTPVSRPRPRSRRPRTRGRIAPSRRFGWCSGRSRAQPRGFRRGGRLPLRAVAGVGERPDDAVAVAEANAALGVALDRVAALVHDAMVLVTEKHEVLEARLAAVRPVLGGGAPADGGGARSRGSSRCGRRVPRAAGAAREAPCGGCDRRSAAGRRARSAPRRSASQPSRRAVSGEISGPSSSSERPRPSAQSAAASTWTTTRARSPRGSSPRRATPRRDRAEPRLVQGAEDRPARAASAAASRLRVVRRCGALLAATLEHALTRRFERLDQQRAVLGREPRPQKQRAVVVEVVVDVLQLVRLPGVLRRNPAEGPKRPLELRCRQRPRKLEQALLGRRRRDPGQRPNLGERELATRERRPRRRQLLQRLRDPQELTRLTPRDPATPGEKARRSLLSPCSRISQTSSSQRAVAALRCADRLASSSTRRRCSRHHSALVVFRVSRIVVFTAN